MTETYKLSSLRIEELIKNAIEARNFAYAPYSDFKVGVALLAKNQKIYQGCNIENAAYTPTNCAERTAFFKAVSEGGTDFTAICIIGGRSKEPTAYTPPCGVCRQVMMEFCKPEEFQIILAADIDQYQIFTLKEMLPMGFGAGCIE